MTKKKNKSSKNHIPYIVIVSVVGVIAIIILILSYTNSQQTVVGEAFKIQKSYETPLIKQPDSQTTKVAGLTTEEIFCPPEILFDNDQDAINLPEGYKFLDLKLTKVECNIGLIICEYENTIRTSRDLSNTHSLCQSIPNNPFGCLCDEK